MTIKFNTLAFSVSCLVLSCFSLLSAFPALAASEDDFKREYENSNGLTSVQADLAYALGFTGKGVVVGVADTYFSPPEGEFKGKYAEQFILPELPNIHGTHVSGIIAALRNGIGMHGIAYDASLMPYETHLMFSTNPWATMLTIPNLRVINNSWLMPIFLDQSTVFDDAKFSSYKYEDDFLESFMSDYLLKDFLPTIVQADKLLVFSAGNSGHLSPSLPSSLPILMQKYPDTPEDQRMTRAIKLRFLNISAFDPTIFKPGLERQEPGFVAPFSNMGLYASDYTLWAPGVKIYSTISPDTFGTLSGTSMAAPIVSGIAALAQSAFPYMTSKQLADVLLSTATPFTIDNVPKVFVLVRQESNEQGIISGPIRVVIYKQASYPVTDADKYAMDSYKLNLYLTILNWTEGIEQIITNSHEIPLPDSEYLMLFGVGIVNAARAVQGPGFFDANRLENTDIWTDDNQYSYALYPVNTQGFDSIWSNNIGERLVTSQADPFTRDLFKLDVGLRKQGDGLIYLTGKNTFSGPTLVEGGGISLGRPGQSDREAELAGDVYILDRGFFTGNGQVSKNLLSKGLIIPGLSKIPGSNLYINGSFTSRGELRFDIWPNGQSNQLNVSGNVDIEGSTVSLNGLDGGGTLPVGSYSLINAGSPIIGTLANNAVSALQGVTLNHIFNLSLSGSNISALYNHSSASPYAKALSEGFLGGIALANQGADVAAGQGLESAVTSASTSSTHGNVSTFGTISAGLMRYNTGSNVDMGSVSLMTGLSKKLDTEPLKLTLGAFLEYGNGSYDTYNSFPDLAIHGNGDTHYLGGGLLARLDFTESGPGHFYTEVTGRAGGTHNEYTSYDLMDHNGQVANYKTTSPYYGIHFGAGYICRISEKSTINLYSKYFWTHLNGDSVTLTTNDPVTFAAVDSSRLRLGSRLSFNFDNSVKPYLGLAYEREFDGKTRASTYGYNLDTPAMNGSTGIGELGLSLAPSANFPLSIDFGLQGYTGKRDGLTGSLIAKLEF